MVQGKFKVRKANCPIQKRGTKKVKSSFTRKANAPIKPKKGNFTENQKIKKAITKAVNKDVENELRARASEGNLKLSKAQVAVANHHRQASGVTSHQAAS